MYKTGVTLELSRLVLRFPPIRKGKEWTKNLGDHTISISGLLEEERPWKLYLIVLWRREGEKINEHRAEFWISRNKMSKFLGNEDAKEVERQLRRLRSVSYSWRENKSGGFVVYGILEHAFFHPDEEKLYVWIPRAFYDLCMETGLAIYATFVPFLRGRTELNLFTFFSVDYRLSQKRSYKEETLFEKSGLSDTIPDKVKRQKIKNALQSLKEVGFIKDFTYQNKQFHLEFYAPEEIRIKAIELGKELEKREEKTTLRRRENKRRQRERLKNSST